MQSDSLRSRLVQLRHARRSAAEYYSALLDDSDDILKIGAWCALLDRKELPSTYYSRLASLSRYAAIRTRAFVFLQGLWERRLATEVANTEPTNASEDAAERKLAQARLSGEPDLFVAAKHAEYLATGRDACLQAILQSVQGGASVSVVLPYGMRAALIRPHDARMVEALLVLLKRAGEWETLKTVLDALDAAALHPALHSVFRAQIP